MPIFDPTNTECTVYVYREGIAAAVGHDLAIEVGDFSIEVDDDSGAIEARFAADSLRVRHAVQDGQPRPGKLSEKDKKKIERNISKDVLEASRFPVITFRSTDVSRRSHRLHVAGTLQLHGVEGSVDVDGTSGDGATMARVQLNQPDFGIEPYRALLGALKIKPQVDIELRVPYVPGELIGGATCRNVAG